MRLHTVTITGADDRTDPIDLARLSAEFPFVEWAILLTADSGRPTFPSPAWVGHLQRQLPEEICLSGHVCGGWAKRLCAGQWPPALNLVRFGRAQLNIGRHRLAATSSKELAGCLPRTREYILQVGSPREPGLALAHQLQELGLTVSVLFDASGGRGRSPKVWPSPSPSLRCGFAGGLGPDNLAGELRRLEEIVGDSVVWIDMQSHVRSSNGNVLDLHKVQRCLELSAPYVEGTGPSSPARPGRSWEEASR
jgi:hypothetical protein